MRALRRKLVNDLTAIRWQGLAIAMVLASGMATFVMSLTALDSLTRARGDYFREANFASVFATLKRAPRALEPRLRAIPGIADLETRIVVPAVLDVRGLAEPATALLVSVPDYAPPQVNRLHLRLGRLPTAERRGEVLVSEAFASASAAAGRRPAGCDQWTIPDVDDRRRRIISRVHLFGSGRRDDSR